MSHKQNIKRSHLLFISNGIAHEASKIFVYRTSLRTGVTAGTSAHLCLVPYTSDLVRLIIYYLVIGHKFYKLLRVWQNQYLLNDVYV